MIALLAMSLTTLRVAGAANHMDIGTAVNPDFFAEPRYEELLKSEFSVIEPENGMKFDPIHKERDHYDFSVADKIVAFAHANHLKVRGHTLVWHSQQPSWVMNGTLKPTEMATILQDHIKTVVGRYRGKVYAWDVVNEAFNDDGSLRPSPWYNKPGFGYAGQGTQYIEQALRWARKADKRAKLFYNDYGTEEINPKSDAVYAMLKDFKNRHVPIDGIGFQCHAAPWYVKEKWLKSFEKNLQRFADLGLEIHITELDCDLDASTPEKFAQQAYVYHEIATIAHRQPKVTLLQIWGFTDKHSWLSSRKGHGWGMPWDANYEKKPAYGALRNGILGK